MSEHALITIGTGVFVGLLGGLIKYAGMVELIAGYDPETVVDEDGLASFVGTNTLYVAVLTVGAGVLELYPATANSGWYWLVFVIAVGAISVRMIRGARRFESTSDRDTPQ
jgi:hypothetical protein